MKRAPTPLSAFPVERDQGVCGPHLVDTTMFWSPAGGGVGRYLCDKRRWLKARTYWRHTLVVAGGRAPAVAVRGMPLPFSGGYRFPLERNRAARQLASLAPDLIEVGDPYRLAWAALDAAQLRGIPAVAYCHSNIMEVAARWLGARTRSLAGRYARRTYPNFERSTPRGWCTTLSSPSSRSSFTIHRLPANTAFGTPVVMPARAGLLDLVDGDAAIGVPRPTPDTLAQAAIVLVESDRDQLRLAARDRAHAFDAARTFERLFARYSALRSHRAQANGSVVAHPYA